MELSIEEKAKAYDEAIKNMRKFRNALNNHEETDLWVSRKDIVTDIEYYFPELKESENWIPKEIIKYLKEKGDFRSCWIAWLEKQGEQKSASKMQVSEKLYEHIRNTCACIDDALSSETLADINDYLSMAKRSAQSAFDMIEKQGEQKSANIVPIPDGCHAYIKDRKIYIENYTKTMPAEKVKPKFKVGDWVTDGFCKCQIRFIDDTQYWYSENCILGSIESVGKKYHLWTIQDAKDGDVLQLGEVTAIFQKYISNENCECYCSVCDGEFEIPSQDSVDNNYGCYNAIPATKEQRNFLFQKMKEAGYEWDTEKKELRKFPTPADVGFEELGKAWAEEAKDKKSAWSEEDEGVLLESISVLQNNSHWVLADKLKSIKERLQQQPKSDWSEEDERNLDGILDEIEANKKDAPDYDIATYDRFLSWLKSLKDRVQSQSKQEWDEEDVRVIKEIIFLLKHYNSNETLTTIHSIEDMIIWLKSLRPQNRWKPSDEQMDALNDVISSRDIKYDVLSKLWKDLKKLRKE